MMAVWSEVDFVDLFEGLDLAAEHYHPKKLEYIELLSRAGGDPVSSIATTVREVVTPSNAVATFDLAAAKSHVVQIDDAQPQARISAKKVAIARDVIVSRLRSYLKQVAVVPPGLGNIHLSTEFIVLRSLSDQNIAFLVPYILSAPIQVILHWSQDGNEHPRFNESVLLSLPVPPSIVNLSTELNRSLATCTDLISQSKSLYAEAEGMLSWALGLDGLDLEGRLYYERPYADLEAAARFDAEYFQPKYYALVEAMHKEGEGRFLGDIVLHCERGLQPEYDDEGEIAVINTKHMGPQFLTDDYEHCTLETWKKQKRHGWKSMMCFSTAPELILAEQIIGVAAREPLPATM